MTIEIKVPDIGADAVEVTDILVNVGDHIEVEQSLITVEGDKASMEVPSAQAGVVKEIKVAVGDKVETGSLIMLFEEVNAAVAPSAPTQNAPASADVAAAVEKVVQVPDIGSDEVEVTEILVREGDRVEAEQSLMTVEGDKASMEIPAPFAGVVKAISIHAGDKVATGMPMMTFEVAQGVRPSAPAEPVAPAQAAATVTKNVQVPDIGSDEVEVTEILVREGDCVEAEQSLMTVEGDKASMEIPAPFAGKVSALHVKTGDKVSTGSLIMTFDVQSAPMVPPTEAVTTSDVPPVANAAKATTAKNDAPASWSSNEAYVHATPLIRRLAREFGVDLSRVKGSGRKGRILKEDVQAYVKEALKRADTAPAAGGGLPGMLPWPKVDFSRFGETEEVELGRIQKISGANLSRNWVMIPHVTQHDEADITELEKFRKQQNAEAEKQKRDVKITPLVFVMKAVAKALQEYPRFNSSLSEDGQTLTLKKYIHIGVAVDTPNGLVVPVFRDVDKKGIIALSRELSAVSKKAREGKLTASDMQGGCFTISSLGGIGGTAFTPIVNAPEVAILGVSKSSIKPIWNGSEFVPRLMLPLSLSFDHRVIDGAAGARFAAYIATIMTDIRRLVM